MAKFTRPDALKQCLQNKRGQFVRTIQGTSIDTKRLLKFSLNGCFERV